MFTVFRSFFPEPTVSAFSGGIFVMVNSTGNIVPCSSTGYAIGTVEDYGGNAGGSPYDISSNTAWPVNVRLFGPTRNVSITGTPTTGFSAGTLVYLAASGQAALTGTIPIGVALTGYPASISAGGQVEIAEYNGV